MTNFEKVFKNTTAILWDFDGVIMDSMPIRDKGFELVLAAFPKMQVAELIKFHKENGGLSRYVKFRYFFEKIRKENITEKQLADLTSAFGELMRRELLNSQLLIEDSLSFIKSNYRNFRMHLVSGSDGEELKFICKSLRLDEYFQSIHGSPTPKNELVNSIIQSEDYDRNFVILVGDSINDFHAAEHNNVNFFGYNNIYLKGKGAGYIEAFKNIKLNV
jgi:phosphoglycolate phosphatase-like HAD superfamily hydrolase